MSAATIVACQTAGTGGERESEREGGWRDREIDRERQRDGERERERQGETHPIGGRLLWELSMQEGRRTRSSVTFSQ